MHNGKTQTQQQLQQHAQYKKQQNKYNDEDKQSTHTKTTATADKQITDGNTTPTNET